MDYSVFLQAVSSVGFPIVCCGVLFVQNNKLNETLSDLKVTLTENTTLIKTLINTKGEHENECKQHDF
jgi:hypothetical protein